MANEQIALSFGKGITNVPSDATCDDNELEESLGMVYSDGEHRPIQAPRLKYHNLTESGSVLTLLYVHKYDDDERFIMSGTSYLYWGVDSGGAITPHTPLKNEDNISNFQYSGKLNITSIGKTLIVSDNYGVHYYLWSGSNYTPLGESFPELNISFQLTGRNNNQMKEERLCSGLYYDNQRHRFDIALNKQKEWNDSVVGIYSRLRNKIWQKKKFHGSFCVRAALKLYDGSYYHLTNPVFMLNHFSAWGMARIRDESLFLVSMQVYGQELEYKFTNDFTKWSDIIKNVVLFVTKEANIYDTTVDAVCNVGASLPSSGSHVSFYMSGDQIYHDSDTIGGLPTSAGEDYQVLQSIPDSDLSDTIKSGIYYKLCEIGIYGDGQWHASSDHFDTHTLENITTQERLPEDDYHSHCSLVAGTLFAYNSRLNLANVSRCFFDGFENFMPFQTPYQGSTNGSALYNFYVTIRRDGSNVVVLRSVTTSQIQGIYFYYPDPRATHVVITKGGAVILNADLTEHPTLNGAFYFAGVSPSMVEPSSASGSVPTVSDRPKDQLPNYVITSEVNNPFVFHADGYTKVGTGKIIGLSTLTQALSQGQFGQYPLVIFSESGIWAASMDGTGKFVAVHPMSREVCNNPRSITQTDGAVFFTSEKGLMMVVGSEVTCVSEQMSGATGAFSYNSDSLVSNLGHFSTFLKSCFIAYDYRDSLLWLFDGATHNETFGLRYCYVYAIKSGTFAKYDFGANGIIKSVCNDYPDYLLQSGSNVYSLTGRVDINADDSIYGGTILTRPMKFDNAMALKTIVKLRHVYDFHVPGQGESSPSVTFRIFACNDLRSWVPLTSLRGTPWKYYRFEYVFANLKATDTFAGTVLVTQERRTNKLR